MCCVADQPELGGAPVAFQTTKSSFAAASWNHSAGASSSSKTFSTKTSSSAVVPHAPWKPPVP
jgi:flagellar capping protein FliD